MAEINGNSVKQLAALDTCVFQTLPPLLQTALELARVGSVSSSLHRTCARELEQRARGRIHLAWGLPHYQNGSSKSADSAEVQEAYEFLRGKLQESTERNQPFESLLLTDVTALTARYAGGWGALLAGREGLLDTEIPKDSRHKRRSQAASRDAILMWDIIREGDGVLWSGVIPLALVLRKINIVDSDDENISCSYVYPQSCNFPGHAHTWRHSSTSMRNQRFQMSASTSDPRTWWHRLSLLAPFCCETRVMETGIVPQRFAQHGSSAIDPSLPEPTEVVPAVDVRGEPIPGVFRFTFDSFYEDVTRWGHKVDTYLHLWIDSRTSTCHTDVDCIIEDAAWPAWLAHGCRIPRSLPQPRKRRRIVPE